LTGLPQPREGRQFIAWRRQPQESRPDPRWPGTSEGGGRGTKPAAFDLNPAIVRLPFMFVTLHCWLW